MVDVLQTGITGLRASQRALATTSHNISNVNTEGYSRQRTEQETNTPEYGARGAMGTGTHVETVQRLSEETRVEALRRNEAEFERLDTLKEMTGRIDNLVADKDAGISPALREFSSAIEEVANDPANTVARQELLTKGQALADRFERVDERLLELQSDVNKRVRLQTEQINGLAESIAEVNDAIRKRWQDPQQPPNDLLDQRDQKVRELAELVGVNARVQRDGTVNVSIGNGQPLVTGDRANDLKVVENAYNPQRPELALEVDDGHRQITDAAQGGSLGGLLEFRSGVLDETRSEIGRVATSLAVSLNAQHARGVHYANGRPEQGGALFDRAEVQVQAHADNRGGPVPEVGYDAERIGELEAQSYQLRYDGSQWQLKGLGDGGQVRTLGEDIEAGEDGAYRFDGLVLRLPSQAEAGDRFQIQPSREAAQGLEMRLSRPEQVAAAAPAVTGEALTAEGQSQNTGEGAIGSPQVGDSEGVMAALEGGGALQRGVELEYAEGEQGRGYFEVYVGDESAPRGRLEYAPEDAEAGQRYNLSGIEGLEGLDVSVRLSGSPDPGDRFQIEGNYEGVGDNANALRMAGLMEETVMDGGNSTFQEAYSAMVGDIGGFTQRVQTNRDAQQALLDQAEKQWEEVSGVNLDEEAANMMEHQQAYQAAAQIITTADEIFQQMLSAVRR